jgi:small subunit ribosomal protein S17
MQDETQRTAADEPVSEAESVLPGDLEVNTTDVQILGGAAARAARRDELKPGQEKPRQMKVGRVVSDKMEKTIIVAVEYTRPHPLYKKAMKRTSKFAAHDEQNLCKIGDIVRIEETRPLSKTKRWIVREIIKRSITV